MIFLVIFNAATFSIATILIWSQVEKVRLHRKPIQLLDGSVRSLFNSSLERFSGAGMLIIAYAIASDGIFGIFAPIILILIIAARRFAMRRGAIKKALLLQKSSSIRAKTYTKPYTVL